MKRSISQPLMPNNGVIKSAKHDPQVKSATSKRDGLRPSLSLAATTPGTDNGYDVKFKIGSNTFLSRKWLLVSLSVVFEAMFFGHFKEGAKAGVTEVQITDIEPETFHVVLESIHGDLKILLDLGLRQAFAALYMARKYCLQFQEHQLVERIKKYVCAQNALQILPYADYYNIAVLTSKCWSFIERETKAVLESGHFVNVSWNTLHLILENNRLTILEFDLYLAVLRWCQAQFVRTSGSNERLNSTGLRHILGVAVYKIRFPRMTYAELDLVKKSGILRDGEIADLRKNLRKNKTFPNEPRKNVCICRKSNVNCSSFCNSEFFPSVDGRSCNKPSPAKSSSSSTSKRLSIMKQDEITTIAALKTLKSGGSTSNDSDEVRLCECGKYLSCPSYPNGTTIQLIMSGQEYTRQDDALTSVRNLFLKK